MKVKGGLTLKREVAAETIASGYGNKIAQLWVDTLVYHLDEPFSYLIPSSIESGVAVGSLVTVPFNGRELIAVVIEISDAPVTGNLKAISKVLGRIPPLSPEIINLIRELTSRYAAHPFDIIRSAIADRVISVERDFDVIQPMSDRKKTIPHRQFLQMPPHRDKSELLATQIANLAKKGSVLVVVPEHRELDFLIDCLRTQSITFTILDSSLSKSDRYRAFLEVRTGRSQIVIGTRSAIFAPVMNLDSILIYNEGSENHYEKRSPGWNVRDVALMRSKIESVNLYFCGYSPSSEIARLIDEGWIEFKRAKARLRPYLFPSLTGELLPSRALTLVRQAIKSGPILFIVPLKGYAQAIRCAQCKTVSHCDCGGSHELIGARAQISCSHCAKEVPLWSCSWCHSTRHSLLSRGAQRHLHDLGLLLPGYVGGISTSEHPSETAPSAGFVISTPNMAPRNVEGYSAVVILEGDRFLSQPDMRAQERIREMYFAHIAQVRHSGIAIIIQEGGEALVNALSTWNPEPMIHRELNERRDLQLPPYVRALSLSMNNQEIIRLKKALETAITEERLPQSTRILGPIPSGEKSSLILTASLDSGESLIASVHQFLKRRSAAKKELPTLRIDPYSLSR